MPVPQSISELRTAPASNSPKGSETVGPNANAYIQAAFAFIAQLASGAGFKLASAFNAGSQKFINLGEGSVLRTSTDALNAAQIIGLCYKVGEVRSWHGAPANIAKVWGAGWQLADGSNGTADMRDRFIVGVGKTYTANSIGGNASVSLKVENLPSHTHEIVDPGHEHAINDPGHAHKYKTYGLNNNGLIGNAYTNNDWGLSSSSIEKTGISVRAARTGIAIQNTGSGVAIDPRPPFYALCFVEYTGIGA